MITLALWIPTAIRSISEKYGSNPHHSRSIEYFSERFGYHLLSPGEKMRLEFAKANLLELFINDFSIVIDPFCSDGPEIQTYAKTTVMTSIAVITNTGIRLFMVIPLLH
ncbi:hypothetical protein [Methanoregula sp.]|uniref:hypothetical protein n=1 Tax=Methanoregula sp. TaxID=2052170 RepID=UPI0026224215|nr:hypothetical protein [Methanoregula sp.]MDD5143055.1 hypothetical protein [Methanoregula sp.]